MRLVDWKAITLVESIVCESCKTILSPLQKGVILVIEGKEHTFCSKRCADRFDSNSKKKKRTQMIIVD